MRSPGPIEGLALLGGTILLAQLALVLHARAIRRAWRRAADRLGLVYVRRRADGVSTLHGTMDGLAISVTAGTDEKTNDDSTLSAKRGAGRHETEACAVITVAGAGACPSGVRLHPVVLLAAARGIPEGLSTGDPEFDARFRIDGPPACAFAMLGREARRSLLDIDAPRPWTLVVTGPTSEPLVRVFVHGEPRGVAGRVRMIRVAAAIARATRLEGGIADALLRNVRSDNQGGVRLRSLRGLIDAMGEGDAAVRDACRHAMDDESVAIRLRAASGLGADGTPVLLALVLDEGQPFDVRAEAFRALVTRADDAEFGALVDRLLESSDAGLRCLAIEGIGERRWTAALSRLLEPGASSDDARAIATALGKLGDPAAEPILIEWLGSPVDGVVAASARALGVVGSIDAVEPLLPLARGVWRASGVREAARDALRSIRSRLGPVEAGRLALMDVDAGAGALSVTDEPTGRVSLEEDPATPEGDAS